MKKFLIKLVSKLNSYTIHLVNPETGKKEPYLTRYYLFGKDRKFGNIYIHHFHNGDLEKNELHSHPFKWSLSLILSGGYKEQIRVNNCVIEKIRKPFTFNYINNKMFHRVDLLSNDCWTIFFVGSRTVSGSWYFWNKDTKEEKHWSTSPNAIP